MVKVVLDTSTYVAALISASGISAMVFESVIQEKMVNFYTKEILFEVDAVLRRKKFNVGREKRERFLHIIQESSSEMEQDRRHTVSLCRDPKDDSFLSLSKQVNADFLITWDEDLLVLRNIGNCRIVTPSEFIRLNF